MALKATKAENTFTHLNETFNGLSLLFYQIFCGKNL